MLLLTQKRSKAAQLNCALNCFYLFPGKGSLGQISNTCRWLITGTSPPTPMWLLVEISNTFFFFFLIIFCNSCDRFPWFRQLMYPTSKERANLWLQKEEHDTTGSAWSLPGACKQHSAPSKAALSPVCLLPAVPEGSMSVPNTPPGQLEAAFGAATRLWPPFGGQPT